MIRNINISYMIFFIIIFFVNIFDLMPSLDIQVYITIFGILSLGLPHGATDYVLAKKIGIIGNIMNKNSFILVYSIIIFLMFTIWKLIPILGFTIFILMSIYHFGEDWLCSHENKSYEKNYDLFRRILFGTLFISLPFMLHTKELKIVFIYLLYSDGFLYTALPFVSYIALCGYFVLFIYEVQKQHYFNIILQLCFIYSGIFFPPIIYFFLYFCLLHSPRHIVDINMKIIGTTFLKIYQKTLGIMILTYILLIPFIIFFSNLNDIISIFYGLIIFVACITVPHMLLVGYYNKSHLGKNIIHLQN